jgi:hypothetical protein
MVPIHYRARARLKAEADAPMGKPTGYEKNLESTSKPWNGRSSSCPSARLLVRRGFRNS